MKTTESFKQGMTASKQEASENSKGRLPDPIQNKELFLQWKRFACQGIKIQPRGIRPIIFDSWKRSKEYQVDPFHIGGNEVSTEELAQRRVAHIDLRQTAVPYLDKLFKIIKGSKSLITLSDEDGIVLDIVSDEETRTMPNLPQPGTIHSERTIGTCGIGTTLAVNSPVQIRAEEHWILSNQRWACSGAPIHIDGKTIGCLCLSCPSLDSHEHSLGLVVASANAIERELKLVSMLKEKQFLLNEQEAILDLVDTGIILIDSSGTVLRNNRIASDILQDESKWIGRHVSEVIPADGDLMRDINNHAPLNDKEIPVRMNNKVSYLCFSTETIQNDGRVEATVIKVREAKAVFRMVNRFTGSRAVYTFDHIAGESHVIKESIRLAKLAAQKNVSVLLLGESGTGKELFAHAIHNASQRRNGPFVAINCGALPRDLIQSELFGYVGGAFTGAKREGNPGKFELADAGTIFLDEIGELPLEIQVNLLRVLETGEVIRIGGKYAKTVSARVIVATNKDLYKLVAEKSFRDDLFYRINTFSIKLPSLRERAGDIRILTDIFLNRRVSDQHKRSLTIDESVYEVLELYHWPGNIRELENVVERAEAVAASNQITLADLPPNIRRESEISGSEIVNSLPPLVSNRTSKTQLEMTLLCNLINQTGGNIREVARRMGVARSTVYNKLKKYNLLHFRDKQVF